MVLGRGEHDGCELFIIGLSDENIVRLVQGQPILVKRETHGDGVPDGWQVLIAHGKTEAEILKQLKPACSDTTQIFKDPRL